MLRQRRQHDDAQAAAAPRRWLSESRSAPAVVASSSYPVPERADRLFASALRPLAAWSAPFVLSLVTPPDTLRDSPFRRLRVFLFGFGLLSCRSDAWFASALRASAVRPVAALKGGEDPHSPRRLMRGAIALQVAFCCLVLFLSSLFVASFQRLQNRPLGFSTDRLLLLEPCRQRPAPRRLESNGRGAPCRPRVDSVAIARWPFSGRIAINSDISINGAPPSPTPAFFLSVSPGWLSTMKIPLVSAATSPSRTSPGAAIVNETFVKTFFPARTPSAAPLNAVPIKTPLQDRWPSSPMSLPRTARARRARLLHPFIGNRTRNPPPSRRLATFTIHTDARTPLPRQLPPQIIAQRHNGPSRLEHHTQLDLAHDQTIRERLIAMPPLLCRRRAAPRRHRTLRCPNYSVLQRRARSVFAWRLGRLVLHRAHCDSDVFLMIALEAARASRWIGAGALCRVAFLPGQSNRCGYDRAAGVCHSAHALVATTAAVLRALRTEPHEILRRGVRGRVNL